MTTKNKELNTLVDDIYNLFKTGHEISESNLEKFALNVSAAVKRSVKEASTRVSDKPILRMSKIGTPDRKLWFDFNTPRVASEVDPATQIKFLYGHILEELLLLFTKEAGHTVEGEQGEVDILGVKGHRDAKIDGITTDIKSASKFAFQKFANGTLSKDDPFGYIAQISGYAEADHSQYGAFLVINKESGEIALLKVDKVDMIDPAQRIVHIKENVLSKPEPPREKCYTPEPFGKSGNEALHKNCSFCEHKLKCWEGSLRGFRYSTGITYLTKVVDTPRVEEVPLSTTKT